MEVQAARQACRGSELALENVSVIQTISIRGVLLNEVEEMNAKEYLSRVSRKRAQMLATKDELDMIRSTMQSVGSMRYDKIRIQTTPDPDPLATYMARIIEKEEKLAKIIDEYMDMVIIVREQLAGLLPGLYSDVLYMRYVEGKSLNKISKELNYSYEYVRKLHGRALKAFTKKYLRQ